MKYFTFQVAKQCREADPRRREASWINAARTVAVLIVIGLVGCADQTSTSASRNVPGPPQPPLPPALAPPATPAAQNATNKKTAKKERVKAQVGVGDKTRRLENPDLVKSIIVPARAYFRARERIAFEIQIPKAMKLYKALNGRAPRDQKEFMEQIIKANQIKLPELRAGERYVYDPKTEQLMVERPARRQ